MVGVAIMQHAPVQAVKHGDGASINARQDCEYLFASPLVGDAAHPGVDVGTKRAQLVAMGRRVCDDVLGDERMLALVSVNVHGDRTVQTLSLIHI